MKEVICIVVFSWVFTHILIDEEMILGAYGKLLTRLPKWLGKPLGLCEYCLGGQIAFWWYLVTRFNAYNVITHIMWIVSVIFILHLINKFFDGF